MTHTDPLPLTTDEAAQLTAGVTAFRAVLATLGPRVLALPDGIEKGRAIRQVRAWEALLTQAEQQVIRA